MQSSQEISKMLNLADMEPIELLRGFSAVIDELRIRGISRTKNNPVADYAEWLVSQKLGLSLKKNSSAGYDAVGPEGLCYQIKSRRVTSDNKSTQLGAIRNLKAHPFDYLIGVLFNADFSIRYAAKIPYQVVVEKSVYRAHQNANIFHFRSSIFDDERVEVITHLLTD